MFEAITKSWIKRFAAFFDSQWIVFLVEAYSKTCFTTSQHILINFVSKKQDTDVSCFFESSTGVAGWLPYLLFVFNMYIFWASFALFWALLGYFFGPMGLFLGSRSGSKHFGTY